MPGAVLLQDALQPQPFFVAGDLARHADVLERRHVDHVAAGQGDVRGDARALLAERLLGDLNDDLLAFAQQVADRAAAAALARASARWARISSTLDASARSVRCSGRSPRGCGPRPLRRMRRLLTRCCWIRGWYRGRWRSAAGRSALRRARLRCAASPASHRLRLRADSSSSADSGNCASTRGSSTSSANSSASASFGLTGSSGAVSTELPRPVAASSSRFSSPGCWLRRAPRRAGSAARSRGDAPARRCVSGTVPTRIGGHQLRTCGIDFRLRSGGCRHDGRSCDGLQAAGAGRPGDLFAGAGACLRTCRYLASDSPGSRMTSSDVFRLLGGGLGFGGNFHRPAAAVTSLLAYFESGKPRPRPLRRRERRPRFRPGHDSPRRALPSAARRRSPRLPR